MRAVKLDITEMTLHYFSDPQSKTQKYTIIDIMRAQKNEQKGVGGPNEKKKSEHQLRLRVMYGIEEQQFKNTMDRFW